MKKTVTEKKLFKRGITLVSLIITIIVLLILAGTAISLSIDSGDLLKKTDTATKTSNTRGLVESASVALILSNSSNEGTFKDKMEAQMPDAIVTEVSGRNDVLHVEQNKAVVTVYENGEVIEGRTEFWNENTNECPEFKKENNMWSWYIYTPAQLKFLADFVNNGNSLTSEQIAVVTAAGYNAEEITVETEGNVTTENAMRIYLMNNLDLGARSGNGTTNEEKWETAENEAVKWTPIGGEILLRGIFEGNNHVIKGIYINENNRDNVGIFGAVWKVDNLTVLDCYVKGGKGTGTIAGKLFQGGANNCHSKNAVLISDEGTIIGGLFRICRPISNKKL